MEIRDPRSIRDFQTTTFSGHPRAHVCKVLLKAIELGHADYACYWTLELLCSGLVHTIWGTLFHGAAMYINRGSPNVFAYLAESFERYMPLESGYTIDNMVTIRNHPDVRKLVCQAAATVAQCRKNKLPSLPTIKPAHDFNSATIHESIRAPSALFGREVLKQQDPYALAVATNELCYSLKADVRDPAKAFYWMAWMIALARETKKATKEGFLIASRPNEYVADVHSRDLVWLFWECIFKHAAQSKYHIDTLFKMYCLRWTPACRKERQSLMVASVVLVCDAPTLDSTPISGSTIQTEALLAQVPQWLDAIQRTQQTFSGH